MPPRDTIRKSIDLLRRGYNKPPHVIALWLWRKFSERRAADLLPKLSDKMTPEIAARRLGYKRPVAVFESALNSPPYPIFARTPQDIANRLNKQSQNKIIERANAACERRVQFLGTQEVTLGRPIDWATDFKSGVSWPMKPSQSLEVLDLDRATDIKIPWELSRLQWLLPAGQAYILSNDEKYAACARDVITEWFDANPVCVGPNWICAMDVAMRAMSMAWLFYACHDSQAWSDEKFRGDLLIQLSLHAEFVLEHLEWSDIAGNHLTTDLAGLVVIGLMLGGKGRAKVWIDKGWELLEEQFPMQVPDDGVCREASVPYHRLVAELFLLPALARRACDLSVNEAYWNRLEKMADFIEAYTRPDSTIPIWGDADDGRALPLGSQALNDHRYLIETLRNLREPPANPEWDETFWWLGPGSAAPMDAPPPPSTGFKDAGAYIMRGPETSVFIDAGPVGMAGRGGHGHNDCLAFDLFMNEQALIIDPGCYVYTSDWRARNWFRGTAAHNTPMIDGEEVNRITRDDWLWYLSDDAKPQIRHWSTTADIDLLVASHSGYQRLAEPVTPVRGIMLEHSSQRLFIADGFEGTGNHDVKVLYTFAPGCVVEQTCPGVWHITSNGKSFSMVASSPDDWEDKIGEGFYSPSYGIRQKTTSLTFSRTGSLKPLAIALMTTDRLPPEPVYWLKRVVSGRFPVPGFKT